MDTSSCVRLRRLDLQVTLHLALCSSSLLSGPMMRCIMASMNQKDSCPRSSSSSLSWCGGRSPWSSDHGDYIRHGFFVPCCAGCAAPQVQVVEVTVVIPQLHRVRHPHVVDFRVVAQRQAPWSCLFMQTIELPHLQFIVKVVFVPVGQVEQASCCLLKVTW